MTDVSAAPESEQELIFTVRVRSFGKPTVVQQSVERELVRVLHQAFGAGRINVETAGELLVFDPLADDGHHDGHDEPITRVATGFGVLSVQQLADRFAEERGLLSLTAEERVAALTGAAAEEQHRQRQ